MGDQVTDWKHEAAERIREAGWVDVPEEKITAELEAAYRRGQSEPHVPRYSLDEIDRLTAALNRAKNAPP